MHSIGTQARTQPEHRKAILSTTTSTACMYIQQVAGSLKGLSKENLGGYCCLSIDCSFQGLVSV